MYGFKDVWTAPPGAIASVRSRDRRLRRSTSRTVASPGRSTSKQTSTAPSHSTVNPRWNYAG